ncbi:MAG: PPOX class F420-dependent oxidoreductase [Nocardioidaceae bacterium]
MAVEPDLSAFVAERNVGSLATIKRDGRPQLSNVSYTYDPDSGLVRMSLTDDRAKIYNLRRDPRASMLVQGAGGWTYAVVEGDMQLTATAVDPHDATVDELIEVFRLVAGKEHPDWDEYRAAMVADRRLVGRLKVTHAYGLPRR